MALALHLVWPCGQLMERERAIRTEGGGDAEEPRALLAGSTRVRGGSLGARAGDVIILLFSAGACIQTLLWEFVVVFS